MIGSRRIFEHKTLIENAVSLSALNVINMMLPLITLPYLLRTVGVANYGAYSVVYVILQYVILLSAYGFNYSTTKDISLNREDIKKVSQIVVSTIVARLIISIMSLIIAGIFVFFYYSSLYFYAFIFGIGIILGDVLNPVWLFQGMEKMKYMTFANLICKLTFTLMVFLFIKTETDWLKITFLYSFGYLTAGATSLIIAKRVFKLELVSFSFSDVKKQIKNGWSIFLSTFFVNMYRNSNIFILGFFVSESQIGIYASAEKMAKASQSLLSPISNVLYPHMSIRFKSKPIEENTKVLLAICKKLSPIFLLSVVFFVIFSRPISIFLLGQVSIDLIKILYIMSPVLFFGGMNYILGFVGLVNLNLSSYFLKAVSISGILSILTILSLVTSIGIYSAVAAMLISEICLFTICFLRIKSIR